MKPATSAARQTIHHLRELTHRQQIVLAGRAAAGIWAALRAWGFQEQVVLIPANTCYIVLWAVLHSGNHPLLVDVDRRTGNLTVEGLEQHRAARPAAVIPCHMYGLPAPMTAICQWAHANGVKIIEDAALALGATVEGQPAGSYGDASILSFGLGKMVDHQVGGALLTDDPAFAREVRRLLADAPLWNDTLRDLTNEWNSLYWALHQFEAQNPRLLTLYPPLFALYADLTVYQLAPHDWMGLPALLRQFPHQQARRTQLVALYDAALGIQPEQYLENKTLCQPLQRPAGTLLWRYPLLVQPQVRDELLRHLWEQGIHEATRWYPALRPMTTALAPQLSQPLTPVAETLGASIINLPLGEGIGETALQRIVEAIQAFEMNI